jgi:kinesin family protein 5
MEFENSEYKRKILLRDDRIKQLEISGKSLMTSMRQQAERHVHELTYLREQIQVVKTHIYTI